MCKRKLDIPVATPIDQREHYVYGCGQLCEDCHRAVMSSMQTEDCTETELKHIEEL